MNYENLPTINAVSEKQRAYAEDMRKNRLSFVTEGKEYVLDRIKEQAGKGGLTDKEAEQVEHVFNNLHNCKSADFWLNYFDVSSEIAVFAHCVAIASLLYGWENTEAKSALCGPVYRRHFRVIFSIYKQFREEMSLDDIEK